VRSNLSRLRLLLVAALAVASIGYGATSGFARTSVYSWPGAVMLHVHTTPEGSSPGYVQSDPYYVDCPNECDRPYDVGQSISLWAYPTRGFAFAKWTTGPCKDSTLNPCTFTIGADTDVTADFSGKYEPAPQTDGGMTTLHVIVDTPCGLCTLAAHSLTRGVSYGPKTTGGCAAPAVMKSSEHAAGSCGLFALVASTDDKIFCFNDGIGTCTAQYPAGAEVTLFAESCGPFLGWEDNDSTDNPRTVTMNASKTVVAAFLFTGFC
jgi:hypothetical protein